MNDVTLFWFIDDDGETYIFEAQGQTQTYQVQVQKV
jgi:hypothetical protein